MKPLLCVVGLAGAITVSISLFTNIDDAHADLNACRALKTELASLRSRSVTAASGGNSSQYNRYANLAKRQQRALRSAERDAVSLRCVTRSGKRAGNGAASCPALFSKIKKMRRNLNKLVKRRDSATKGSSRGLSRSDLRAKKRFLKKKISRLRCNQIERQAKRDIREQKRVDRRKNKRGGLLARLSGRQSRYVEPEIQNEEQPTVRVVGTVFRTLCVRISDGYYFPMSFATVRSNFDTDEAKCKASNPGEELRLFVHRNPSQEPEEMIDLTGLAYADLPNAFLYRTKFVAPRRLTNGNGLTQVAGVTPGQLAQANDPRFSKFPNLFGETGKIIEKPAAKPALFSDPDTAFSIAGNFTLKPVYKIEKPKDVKIASAAKSLQTAAGESIRVIGPKFLDGQQSVKLLLAPDQIQVQ